VGSGALILARRRFAVSWSGGKDSALALDRAVRAGGSSSALFTMFTEGGERSRSHGLPREILAAQAAALSVPLVTRSTTWSGYEEAFVDGAREVQRDLCIDDFVFGDIDLEDHRAWCVRVTQRVGAHAHHPLWQSGRRDLLDELFERGWRAVIVAVRDSILSHEFLGRLLDPDCVTDLERAGSDACGENGEYHTVVIDGPLFRAPLELTRRDIHTFDGCSFLDVATSVANGVS
jgi:uncharacterized protein (TIGR00290 family)